MKKLTALVICLLLVVGMLSVTAFAAEEKAPAAESIISVVEDKSFVELDGSTVRVDELEAKGYELVLTPAKWDGELFEQAPQELKAAYEVFDKTTVAERVEEDGNQEYWHQTGKNIYNQAHVLDYAFFDASVVKTSDNTKVESAKVTLTVTPANPFAIIQVLNQKHDDAAWNALNYTVEENNIVCVDGATGLYAFLVPQGGHELDDYVPSVEQWLYPEVEEQPYPYDYFVFDTAVWYGQEVPSTQAVKAAYTQMAKTPVAELNFADGGEKLKETGIDLSKLVVSDFLDVSIVKEELEYELERDAVIFEVPVAYAEHVRMALHQLPDGTWKVVELMFKPGNESDQVAAVTVSDGGTGVYALLVEEAVRDEILAGKYDRADLFK